MQLTGKTALVTGGTHGIGAATAIEFARRGADVAVNARHDDEGARDTMAQIEALGRRCALVVADVGRPADATRCVEEASTKLAPIDVLVHSAGGAVIGGLLDLTPETWHEGFDVHVHAVFHLCRAAVPTMKRRREGAIVLVSSVAGLRGVKMHTRLSGGQGGAAPAHAGLGPRARRRQHPRQLRGPGHHPHRLPREDDGGAEAAQHLDHRIPLHREGTPEQVASLVAGARSPTTT